MKEQLAAVVASLATLTKEVKALKEEKQVKADFIPSNVDNNITEKETRDKKYEQ